jgi:hypothetical protein
MALKINLDTLEGIDESIAALYIEKDGKFYLDVEQDHDKNRIPISRLNQEIEKRRAAENTVEEIAEALFVSVPENMRDIIPNLPPAEKIKWIQTAEKKGLFNTQVDSIDSKKPGDKKPQDFSDLSPQAIMAQGYKGA